MFLEAEALTEIPGPPGAPPFTPFVDPAEAPGGLIDYTPPEVTDPDFGNCASHPAQRLSCFWPHPPARSERFPTIVYSPAGNFSYVPPPPILDVGFLTEALSRGWAVISVGTVGVNSLPVQSCPAPQEDRCLDTNNVPPCWDYSLWYEPDEDASSPWNDFNYFYGEKDFVWARQYVAENQDVLHVDDDRVVLCGRSTGAIYSAFVGFASEPWKETTFPGSSLSDQVKADISVAGVVLFEINAWLQGVPPEGAASLPFPGFHWPLAAAPKQRTAWASNVTPREVLNTNSPSRWVRESTRRFPVFIATGDGAQSSTFFGRNANLPENSTDYDRDPASAIPNDPVYTFDFPSNPDDSLHVHGAWHAWQIRKDLDLLDPVYYGRYGVLHMREDLNWSFFPATRTASGSVLSSPLSNPGEVELLEGVYAPICAKFPATTCGTLHNLDLAPRVVDWLECVVADQPPGVTCATAEPNPNVFTSSSAVLGQGLPLTVDVDAADAGQGGYDHAVGFGFIDLLLDGSTWLKISLAGAGGTSLLCFDADGSGDVIAKGATRKDDGTGLVTWTIPLPNQPALLGQGIGMQTCVYDFCATGSPGPVGECTPPDPGEKLGPLATNAVDAAFLAP